MRSILLLNRLLVVLCVGSVYSQTYEDATTLRSTLLSGYHKDIRPLNNQSHTLQVNISMFLYGMPEVDGVKSVIRITVATQALWIDERMSWNPAEYGGISKLAILMKEVWTPSISLGTPVEFAVMGLSQSHVTYYSNGLAVFFPGAVLESSCRFNMKFWPFDKQTCQIGFFPLDYLSSDVTFLVPPNGLITQFYSPNAEWTLEDTSYGSGEYTGFSMAYFTLKFKRQSLFYVLTIILPINGIIGLTSLVFLLPSESGERVSYVITIMLSLAVFLTVVSEEIPKSSEPVSLMCCYILAGIVVSIVGTIAAILNLAVYHRNEDNPKQHWHMALIRLIRCKRNTKVQSIQEEINEPSTKHTKISEQFPVKRNTSKINFVTVKSSESERQKEEIFTWKEVSHAIDKLLFYTIVIVAYIPSVFFLVYLGTASDYQDN